MKEEEEEGEQRDKEPTWIARRNRRSEKGVITATFIAANTSGRDSSSGSGSRGRP